MRSYSAAAARVEHRFDPRRPFLVALARSTFSGGGWPP